MRGCPGENICTVVYDYDENYVCAGINAASQEVLCTCKPFGVIVIDVNIICCWYQCHISGGVLHD